MNEVERKGCGGGLADDAHDEVVLGDLNVAQGDASREKEEDCGDSYGVHPGDEASDVEPVGVEVIDEGSTAVDAGDAKQAQEDELVRDFLLRPPS